MKKICEKKPIVDKSPALSLVKEQAERIAELKQENARLSQKIDEYAAREKEVCDTLSFAKKKCEEMVSDAKVKYALECERLKLYREKWLAAAKDGYLRYGLEQTDRILQECRAELERAFADDLGVSDYLSERDRIEADPDLNYRAIIAEEQVRSPKTKPGHLNEKELEELLKQI